VVDVTGRHSDFDLRIRVKLNKYDDRRFEVFDVDRLEEITHPDDYKLVKTILETDLPDDISFIWN